MAGERERDSLTCCILIYSDTVNASLIDWLIEYFINGLQRQVQGGTVQHKPRSAKRIFQESLIESFNDGQIYNTIMLNIIKISRKIKIEICTVNIRHLFSIYSQIFLFFYILAATLITEKR